MSSVLLINTRWADEGVERVGWRGAVGLWKDNAVGADGTLDPRAWFSFATVVASRWYLIDVSYHVI